MHDPIRDRIEGYAQPPSQEIAAAASTVVARGRRRLRRHRAFTLGSLLVVVLLTGIAVAGAIGSSGSTKITTGGQPAGPATTGTPIGSNRSIGLTQAQERKLFTDHVNTLESCMESKGFDVTIEVQSSGEAGRVRYGNREVPTADEQRAMRACGEVAASNEKAERDRLLHEAGNPVVTLALSACPALENVVRHGDLPARFNTSGVEGKAGGNPLNTCFGTITTMGWPGANLGPEPGDGRTPVGGQGTITVSEGQTPNNAVARRAEGSYLVGPTDHGFLAVYNSDQFPSHYIEATGVTAAEFDALIRSL